MQALLSSAIPGTTPSFPLYKPPTPTLHACILIHHNIFSDNFSTPAFAEAIQNVFINVGLAPQPGTSTYVKYTSHDDKIRVTTNHIFKRLGPVYHVPAPQPNQFSPGDLFEDFIVGREALSRLVIFQEEEEEEVIFFGAQEEVRGSGGAGGGRGGGGGDGGRWR